jgi:hypothetical protein
MDTTLREHIQRLEQKLKSMTADVTENRLSSEARNRTDAEIRAVNLALSHYREALELEKSVLR